MYQLSCDVSFWASQNLKEALAVADTLHINNIELSDIEGKALEQCSGNEVEDIRNALIDSNKTIVLLNTDLPVTDTVSYNELFRKAHLLHVQNVRIVLEKSLSDSEAITPDSASLAQILRMAELWNIGIVFENNHASFFKDNDSMTAFLGKMPEHTALVFNPMEFVALQKHPFFHVFYNSKLKNRVRFLRLNDSLYSTGEAMPLAGGNGEIKELISILLSRSFDGYFSITPYREYSAVKMLETLEEYRSLLKNM